MLTFSAPRSQPLTVSAPIEGQVYGLTALAMGLTTLGVYIGGTVSVLLFSSGLHFLFLLIQLGILFTAQAWREKTPLNYILFGIFPLLSGITIAPFLLYVGQAYTNGMSILFNARATTVFMTLAAAVLARGTGWDLSGLGRGLVLGILGLLFLGILQLFIPSLQTGTFELLLSGAGVVLFSLFIAYDLQRIREMSRFGASPFLMALSLYLDIFNLFLYVVRFMMALSGERR